MGKLEKMREEYDNISIPKELGVRIQQEIDRSQKKQEGKNRASHINRFRKTIHIMEATAAAAGIVFISALNVSPVFAQEAAQLPVVGSLARVLTFRSYEEERDDIAISVEVPTIEMITQDTGITVDGINQEIYNLCDEYADEAITRAEEYRIAFLDTGGTLEEWAEHNIKITVDYEIKQQGEAYLSFVVSGTESWTSAYSEARYYNLDLRTGEIVTLHDMLGDDYIELVDKSIREQISARQTAGEVFFAPEEGGFTGITKDARFYINENNNPVIVFEKYEIAPGSSGSVEFEIVK